MKKERERGGEIRDIGFKGKQMHYFYFYSFSFYNILFLHFFKLHLGLPQIHSLQAFEPSSSVSVSLTRHLYFSIWYIQTMIIMMKIKVINYKK